MFVPRPGTVRMYNVTFSSCTRTHILTNPSPSLVAALVVMLIPLSSTLRARFCSSDRKLTLIAFDLARPNELLIES
jgi:hypothetical protein